uniref:Uncharacterized protein n=1 Tax=Tetranychus urticae TaxID=32264 RepID=T1K7S0_TETUR
MFNHTICETGVQTSVQQSRNHNGDEDGRTLMASSTIKHYASIRKRSQFFRFYAYILAFHMAFQFMCILRWISPECIKHHTNFQTNWQT